MMSDTINIEEAAKMKVDIYIGEKLEELIRQKGISKKQLAKKSGVDERTIRNIINQRQKPRSETLIALCEALEITRGEFYAETDFRTVNDDNEKALLINYRKLDERGQGRVIGYAYGLVNNKEE